MIGSGRGVVDACGTNARRRSRGGEAEIDAPTIGMVAPAVSRRRRPPSVDEASSRLQAAVAFAARTHDAIVLAACRGEVEVADSIASAASAA
jgi:hypothetical protein